MTDDELARRVCKLLGWTVAGLDGPFVCYVPARAVKLGEVHNIRRLSWPDLSAAALRHVEGKGWLLLSVDNCFDDDLSKPPTGAMCTLVDVETKREPVQETVDGPASTALYRALCAAACQTQDALG